MSKYRTTVEIIRSGQPEPYADTEYVVQVTFERTTYQDGDQTFHPYFMAEESALRNLRKVDGFIERKRGERREGEGYMDADFATYLDYVKPIDHEPGEVYAQENYLLGPLASIWEFRTVSRYTD
jgi:hypothetical protein